MEVEFKIDSSWGRGATAVACHPIKPLLLVDGHGATYGEYKGDFQILPYSAEVLNWEIRGPVLGFRLFMSYLCFGTFIDDEWLAFVSGETFFVNVVTGEMRRGPICGEQVAALGVHPNGRTMFLIWNNQDNYRVSVFDRLSQTSSFETDVTDEIYDEIVARSFVVPDDSECGACFSSTGEEIVIGGKELRFYAVDGSRVVRTLTGTEYPADFLGPKDVFEKPGLWGRPTFFGAGRRFAAANSHGGICCWNTSTFEIEWSLPPDIGHVWSFAVSASSRYLATITKRGGLSIWELND